MAKPSSEHPDLKPISVLPDTAIHRPVDKEIDAADKEGYLRAYIILPGTVWGTPTGVAFDKEFSNPHSQQIPSSIERSMKKGQGSQAGKGKSILPRPNAPPKTLLIKAGLNVWAHVRIDEVQSLFAALYPGALADKHPHGGPNVSGYYFAIAGEYQLGAAIKLIGDEMHKQGWAKTAEVVTASEEELKDLHGDGWFYPGTNSRGIAENSFNELKWKPTRGIGANEHEWEEYVRSETRRVGKAYKDKQ